MAKLRTTSVNLRPDIYASQVQFCEHMGTSWNALIGMITLWAYHGPKGDAVCKWAHLSMEGKKYVPAIPGGRSLKGFTVPEDIWATMRKMCSTYDTTVTAILEAAWDPFRAAHYYWDPTEKTTNLAPPGLDGVWYRKEDTTCCSLVRFYPDGMVISATISTPDLRQDWLKIDRWFNRGHANKGTYQKDGTCLIFSTTSDSGKVDYTGCIEDGYLILDSYSHINGHRAGRRQYCRLIVQEDAGYSLELSSPSPSSLSEIKSIIERADLATRELSDDIRGRDIGKSQIQEVRSALEGLPLSEGSRAVEAQGYLVMGTIYMRMPVAYTREEMHTISPEGGQSDSDRAAAADCYRKSLQAEINAYTHYLLGGLLADMDSFPEAIEHLRTAHAMAQNSDIGARAARTLGKIEDHLRSR